MSDTVTTVAARLLLSYWETRTWNHEPPDDLVDRLVLIEQEAAAAQADRLAALVDFTTPEGIRRIVDGHWWNHGKDAGEGPGVDDGWPVHANTMWAVCVAVATVLSARLDILAAPPVAPAAAGTVEPHRRSPHADYDPTPHCMRCFMPWPCPAAILAPPPTDDEAVP